MHLAFDAKRAFHNRAGLGNYSRNLLMALMEQYPETRFSLFTPKIGKCFSVGHDADCKIVLPSGIYKKVPSAWRSYGMKKELFAEQPDLFHGLSHELPYGIHRMRIKSVVTIHDLIFERYPEWYQPADRVLYRLKYRYACRVANRIIAIGQQTADDLQEFWKVEKEKIDVVRQSCHPRFSEPVSEDQKQAIARHYQLPHQFILQVGTIEPRKNQLNSVKALLACKSGLPLVFAGKATGYIDQIRLFVSRNHLDKQVIFINNLLSEHLPALYQMASLTLYPSVFEGFGIPVLESIVSGTPVVTTNKPCFTDAGGEAACYVSPDRPDELADAIDNILSNKERYETMRQRGFVHASSLTPELFATSTMKVYQKTLEEK